MKTRIDIRIDPELKDFLVLYAKTNHTTISRILIDYIVQLKKKHAKDLPVQNLSDSPRAHTSGLRSGTIGILRHLTHESMPRLLKCSH